MIRRGRTPSSSSPTLLDLGVPVKMLTGDALPVAL